MQIMLQQNYIQSNYHCAVLPLRWIKIQFNSSVHDFVVKEETPKMKMLLIK